MSSNFIFYSSQRKGIIWLVLIVVLIELGWYFYKKSFKNQELEVSETLVCFQKQLESLQKNYRVKKDTIYPFNPSRMTDYKGYVLGLSVEQIDRVKSYVEQGNQFKSLQEFQQVSQIDDSLLRAISPYLKFPSEYKKRFSEPKIEASVLKSIPKMDINQATEDDLRKVKGIGEVLSKRIIRYRKRLGGFLVLDQVLEVYGIDSQVFLRLQQYFEIQTVIQPEKKNINTLTVKQLSENPYIDYNQALEIVALRSQIGNITSVQDLKKIQGFTDEKIGRILLYLSLEHKE